MNHKSEKGYSLIGVLLIITIVAIIGVSLAGITLQSVKTSTKERDNQTVYYIAEAGMEYVTHQLKTKVKDISEASPSLSEKDLIGKVFENDETYVYEDNKHMITYRDFESIEGKGTPEASITFAVNENPSENPEENTTPYEITSIGEVGSEKRAVGTTFGIERVIDPGEEAPPSEGGTGQGLPKKYAIFVEEDVNVRGNVIVKDVNFPGHSNTYVGITNTESEFTEAGLMKVDKPAKHEETKEPYTFPKLPPFPKPSPINTLNDIKVTSNNNNQLHLNQDTKINKLEIAENKELLIESSGEVNLVVDELILNKNSKIDIKNKNNPIYLHVNNKFKFSSSNTINKKDNESNLYLFYGSDENLLINNAEIYGSLYVKKAELRIVGNTVIRGNIFSGGDYIHVKSSMENRTPLFLAPNATFTFRGAIKIFGMFMVKTIDANINGDEERDGGNFELHYQDCSNKEYNGAYYQPDSLLPGHPRNNYCPDPKIEGPISIKAVDDYNSGGSSNNGGGNENGGNNGSEGSESSSINNIGKVKEVPLN